MGIVNLTPDSFSDGGLDGGVLDSLRRCEQLVRQGADLLDLGAESTRPGATPLDTATELARLLPVLKEAVSLGVPVSVDTYKPQVMRAALDLGADLINDIWALRWHLPGEPNALEVLARYPRCGVCLMHMHLEPQTMQLAPMQGAVMPAVVAFLRDRLDAAVANGIDRARVAIDPGIGFGKTVEQNLELLADQASLLESGAPLVVGWSRKSSLAGMSAEPTPLAVNERLVPSVVAAVLAVQRGADVVRVHDVPETVQALKLLERAR